MKIVYFKYAFYYLACKFDKTEPYPGWKGGLPNGDFRNDQNS